MRKHLTLFLVMVATLGLSSCTKTDVIENFYPNPNISFIYERAANQWNTNSSQIWLELAIPELDNRIMNQGGVQVSMSFDDENTYEVLPATFEGVAYSVNYSLGTIAIYGQDPILEPGIGVDVPEFVIIKVVLMDTDYIE